MTGEFVVDAPLNPVLVSNRLLILNCLFAVEHSLQPTFHKATLVDFGELLGSLALHFGDTALNFAHLHPQSSFPLP